MNTKHASFDKPWRSLGAQRRRRPVALQLLGLVPHEANRLECPAGPCLITPVNPERRRAPRYHRRVSHPHLPRPKTGRYT